MLATQILRRLGYRPETADSGEKVVVIITERSFDLVILDMLMPPGMDGLDTYSEIVRIRPDQKAIIASGFSESKRVREARTLGVNAYVRKPYTLSQISEAVRTALTPS
jgi:DNA-binding NtrC family response regulator